MTKVTGVGQKLARVDNIADDASGTNKYAQYQYIGGSMIVSISHPEVSGGLNLSFGSSGTYGGWDRFGRVISQHWTDDAAGTFDQIGHTYDRNSNRLTRDNALNSALDEVYSYDGLDRLIDTNRNGANLQDWTLDSLGNWRGFTDGASTQTRTNNAANEITGITGVSWVTPVYDAAGNMTSGPKPGDETTRLHFKYDPWNRLVEVKADKRGKGEEKGRGKGDILLIDKLGKILLRYTGPPGLMQTHLAPVEQKPDVREMPI